MLLGFLNFIEVFDARDLGCGGRTNVRRVSCLAHTRFPAFGKKVTAHQWVPLWRDRTTFPTNLAK